MNTHVRDNENALNSSLTGDNEPTVPHQHKNGTYANRPAAATAGRLYVATDLGPAVFMDTGTTWVLLAAPPRITEYYFEDFIQQLSLGWNTIALGSGSSPALSGNSSTQRIQTGATNASAITMVPRGLAGSPQPFYAVASSRVPAILEAKLSMNTLTQSDYRFGLASQLDLQYSTNPVDAIYFKRVAAGSAVNISSVTRASSTETANDLGVGNDTTIHALRIEILSTSSIQFYVDDVLKATHTTNIPTVNLTFGAFTANNEAVNKTMDIDYVSWLAKRL